MGLVTCKYDYAMTEASVNEVNLGTYRVGYIITTDTVMGPQSVANAALTASGVDAGNINLPSLWSSYSYQGDTDPISYARNYDVRRDAKSKYLWYITVNYTPLEPGAGSQTVGGDPICSEPNPMQRGAVVWWDREINTVIADQDVFGNAVLNKCGDHYEESIELEKPKSILVVEINVATLAEVVTLQRTFDNAVNASPWTIGGATVSARAALCLEVSSSPPMTEQGYTYFHVSFRFKFAEEGHNWDVPKAEHGQFFWVKDEGGEYELVNGYRKIESAEGKFVALDEDGTRLADDADTIYTNWRVRREVNFNNLAF